MRPEFLVVIYIIMQSFLIFKSSNGVVHWRARRNTASAWKGKFTNWTKKNLHLRFLSFFWDFYNFYEIFVIFLKYFRRRLNSVYETDWICKIQCVNSSWWKNKKDKPSVRKRKSLDNRYFTFDLHSKKNLCYKYKLLVTAGADWRWISSY